jgi:hypothetical protein
VSQIFTSSEGDNPPECHSTGVVGPVAHGKELDGHIIRGLSIDEVNKCVAVDVHGLGGKEFGFP